MCSIKISLGNNGINGLYNASTTRQEFTFCYDNFVKDEIDIQKINQRIPVHYIAPCPFWAMLWI